MGDTRITRRIAGMLRKRLTEAELEHIRDPRDRRGRRWALPMLLRAVLVGLAAGCKSLADVELLTESMSPAMRRWLGLPKRVPDTTLRDMLGMLPPEALRPTMHRLVRKAQRRKALEPSGFPFGVVALDGKATVIAGCDDFYAQRQTQNEAGPLLGALRTVTAALTTSPARPVIDVLPIEASTNEMGTFEKALDGLLDAYGSLDLFRLVTYDAGACSLDNATYARRRGVHYLFGLKGSQPALLTEAIRCLGGREAAHAAAVSEDVVNSRKVVRRVYVAEASQSIAAPIGWEHLRTVVRIHAETFDGQGRSVGAENRYFISSLPLARLSAAQWLLLVRMHWGVETAHQVLDVSFQEDDHPWVTSNPRTTLVIAVLRRVVYTLLSLFRSVTQRSSERRAIPWKRLLAAIFLVLVRTTHEQLDGMKPLRALPS